MPKVSIIIPIYNSSHTLVRCLDSIRDQSCGDFEVLLVDDGSTDNSADICRQYANADSRFHLLQQANAGPSAARNAGLEVATGEWISFVDSDDWVFPNIYDDAIYNAEAADLIIFGFRIEELGRKTDLTYEPSLTKGKEIISTRYNDLKVFLWNKLFKRDIISSASLRFPSGIKYGEDLIFLLDYLNHVEDAMWSDKIGYHYNLLSESAAAHLSFKQMELPLFASNLNSIICAFASYSKTLSNPKPILSSAAKFFYSSFYARPIAKSNAIERAKSFYSIILQHDFLKPDANNEAVHNKLPALIFNQDAALTRLVSIHNKTQAIKHVAKMVVLRILSFSHFTVHHSLRIH